MAHSRSNGCRSLHASTWREGQADDAVLRAPASKCTAGFGLEGFCAATDFSEAEQEPSAESGDEVPAKSS